MASEYVLEKEKIHKLIGIRHLTTSTYVLRFDKKSLDFKAGQYITVGKFNVEPRQYSVYSPNNVEYLEVLIKEVEDGKVSRQLKYCKPGDNLVVDGPFGHFIIKDEHIEQHKKFLFIGTGTGISPFHSFVGSYPNLNYQLIHGVHYGEEAYEKDFFDPDRMVVCTSKDQQGDFAGRVTDYLKNQEIVNETEVYLCGNSEMILDVFDILENKGFPTEQIHTEVYF
ncbi:MAG: oxidoreductase [Bacteroidetes bacterium]|jgi:ferredoxin--NADP+ reductase/benzoate/toluate 1,2-dioxygenase reductase subunit|nr:oxidoreductase [Bacteroidota bacterium]